MLQKLILLAICCLILNQGSLVLGQPLSCATNNCDQNADCNDIPGGFACICIAGYNGNGITCSDIDECLNSPCPSPSRCINTVGSFTCNCSSGFMFNDNSSIVCEEIDVCSRPNTCILPHQLCSSNGGSFFCFCDANSTANPDGSCTPLTVADVCSNFECPSPSQCMNTDGNLTCDCLPGFRFNNTSLEICIDIDECFTKTHNCTLPNQICVNTIGGFNCECNNETYTNENGSCTTNTGSCAPANITEDGKTYFFGRTLPFLLAYSEQRCPAGYPIALIRCVAPENDFTSEFAFFDLQTFDAINCTNNTIFTITSQVERGVNYSSRFLIDQSRLLSHLLEENSGNLTNEETIMAINFVETVSEISNTRPVSSFLYEHIVAIGDRISEQVMATTVSQILSDRVTSLVQSLSNIGFAVEIDNRNLRVLTPNIAAEIIDLNDVTQPVAFQATVYSANSSQTIQPVSIDIPAEALEMARTLQNQGVQSHFLDQSIVRNVFLLYRMSTLFPSQDETDWVASADIAKQQITGLTEPVIISHRGITATPGKRSTEDSFKDDYFNQTCVSWDFTINDWSSEGCFLVEGTNPAECRCTHLTNFALIFNVYRVPANVALSVASKVGCSVSIVCLALTVVALSVPKKILQKRSSKVNIHICLNLICVYIVFLAGIDKRDSTIGCIIATMLLQYFLLSTMCWMAVYAYTLYKSLVKIFDRVWSSNYMRIATTFGYLTPLVIVVINAIIALVLSKPSQDPPIYQKAAPVATSALLAENLCWLHSYSLYFAFLLPFGLIIIFNAVMFFLVVRNVTWNRKKVSSSRNSQRGIREHLVIAITIFCSLGLIWVVGYFMILSDTVTFFFTISWLFTVFASLQGVFIFLLHCVRNSDVKNEWGQRFGRKKGAPVNKYISSAGAKDTNFKNYGKTTSANGESRQNTLSTNPSKA